VAIGKECDCCRRTIINWKKVPEFRARVEEIRAAYKEAIEAASILNKVERVRILEDAIERLQQLIKERAEDPTIPDEVAGKSTGLLVRSIKGIGRADDYHEIDVYQFDSALLSEMRALLAEARKEAGDDPGEGNITVIVDV
jgi:hypothetical protein